VFESLTFAAHTLAVFVQDLAFSIGQAGFALLGDLFQNFVFRPVFANECRRPVDGPSGLAWT